MKYFTSTLLKKINDSNEDTRENALKEWQEQSQKYMVHFREVCKKLPSEFLKLYEDHAGFHDFKISGISYQDAQKPYVIISLKTRTEEMTLTFSDVQQFFINIIDKTPCIMGLLAWGYCEFDMCMNDAISVNILCDIENEIKIVFKTISAIKK